MVKFTLPYKVMRRGEKAIVFVHGFLDSGDVWKTTAENIDCEGFEFVTLDLPGMGIMNEWRGTFDLHSMAETVVSVIDALDMPCVLAGHSMGAQIAELAAVARPEKVEGLVLLSPIPLEGVPVDEATAGAMQNIGKNPEGQIQLRKSFSPELTEKQMEMLLETGMKVKKETAAALFDSWSKGVPEGKEPSAFKGKVHIIAGVNDPFATQTVIETKVKPRFCCVSVSDTLREAGHWPHVSSGEAVGKEIEEFIKSL